MSDTLRIDFDPDTRADLCRLDERGTLWTAHVLLDLRTDTATVSLRPPNETGIPMPEWYGLVRAYRLPEAVDALMLAVSLTEEERPLRAALLAVLAAYDGIERDADGNPHPVWTTDVALLDEAVAEACAILPVLPGGIWRADDWLQHVTVKDCQPKPETWQRLIVDELRRLHCDEIHVGWAEAIDVDADGALGLVRLSNHRTDKIATPAATVAVLGDLPDEAGCSDTWAALMAIPVRRRDLHADTTDVELDALARALVDEALADGAAVVGMAEFLTETRGRLRGESVQYVELIEKVEAAVAGWSDWDWARDFPAVDDVVTIEGPVTKAEIAHLPADTQGGILDHQERVRESVARAHEHGRRAVECLRHGDIVEAVEALRAASSEELTWGDEPTWGPVVAVALRLQEAEQSNEAPDRDHEDAEQYRRLVTETRAAGALIAACAAGPTEPEEEADPAVAIGGRLDDLLTAVIEAEKRHADRASHEALDDIRGHIKRCRRCLEDVGKWTDEALAAEEANEAAE